MSKRRKGQFLAISFQKEPNSQYFYLTIIDLRYKRPSIERTYVSSIQNRWKTIFR